MRAETLRVAFVFLGAVAARVLFHALTGFVADDAFITFRYADNIAHGLGFVYNSGQHVLGTSTPLFTFLLSLTSLAGIPPVHSAQFISLVASGMTAVVLYRYGTLWRLGAMSWLPAVVYTVWPRSVPSETCGMETALFTALCVGSLYYVSMRKPYLAIALATLATVTRIEGGLLLALILLTEGYHHRHSIARFVAVPAVILAPWVLFAWQYFGSPLPHSIQAKLTLYAQLEGTSFADQLGNILGFHSALSVPFWALVVLGAVILWRTRRDGLHEIAWLAAMILFFAISPSKFFFWYAAPLAPVGILFVSVGAAWMFERLPQSIRLARWTGSVMMMLVLAALLVAWKTPVREYARFQDVLNNCHASIGHFLAVNAKETDVIAAEDIGYMGYVSNRRILDRDGLVSPESVPYNRAGRYYDLIRDYRPEWVVASNGFISPFLVDSSIYEDYDAVKTFATGQTAYQVFRKK